MELVKLTDLRRLKERDPLWFGEETYAIRRHRSMTISFPLNEVKDELRDLRSPDDDKAVRVFNSFFSHGESDFDDEPSDPSKKDSHEGQLTEDGRPFETPDSGFRKDMEVFFSGTVGSFRSGTKGPEFLIARGSPDDFGDESGMLFDGHMFNEAMVIDEESAGLRVFF
jgi:hypothetical protein